MALNARRLTVLAAACLIAAACSDSPTSPDAGEEARTTDEIRSATWTLNARSDRNCGVIFVISQGLFFDTRLVTDRVTMHGEFQLLIAGRTAFGPGQPGFLNGRFFEDLNRNGIQDLADHFFVCSLITPGRLTP